MKTFLVFVAASVTALCWAQSSPEEAVTQFAAAWNAKDAARMSELVWGAEPLTHATQFISDASKQGWGPLNISEVHATISGERAVVNYKLSSTGTEEAVFARKSGDRWQVVGVGLLGRYLPGASGVERIASGLMDFEIVYAAKSAAQRTTALSQAKQLALGAEMLAADHDDTFALNAANVRSRIDTYTKNPGLWKVSLEGAGDYIFSFNVNLFGKAVSAVASPAETVLIYLGKGEKLDFPFNGYTVVAYVDGHAKVLGKEAAKKLLWKP